MYYNEIRIRNHIAVESIDAIIDSLPSTAIVTVCYMLGMMNIISLFLVLRFLDDFFIGMK